MRLSFVAAVALSAALLHAGVNTVQHVTPFADLTVSGSKQPPFVLANPCGVGESAITFWLTVRNSGAGTSAASSDPHIVWVQDSANAGWAAGSLPPLPAIAPGASVPVSVTLLGLKNVAAMAGHHVFNVTVNGAKTIPESSFANNTMTIAVDVPPGFCAPPSPIASAKVAQTGMAAPLPAPTNLVNTIKQSECAKYGGAAASLACSIGIPAGKLVLLWDYPFQNTIDGFRVYRTGGSTPVATQSVPGVRLMVLDAPQPGTCFTVSAFHGTDESARSATPFCVTNSPKTVMLKADRVGTALLKTYLDLKTPVEEQLKDPSHNFSYESNDQLMVGSEHYLGKAWGATGKSVEVYMNTSYTGYIHFNMSQLAIHQIVKAELHLQGATTYGSSAGETCLTGYGAALGWKPGDPMPVGPLNPVVNRQGPDLHIDVLKFLLSHTPNDEFALGDGNNTPIKVMKITQRCVTTFHAAMLSLTYY